MELFGEIFEGLLDSFFLNAGEVLKRLYEPAPAPVPMLPDRVVNLGQQTGRRVSRRKRQPHKNDI